MWEEERKRGGTVSVSCRDGWRSRLLDDICIIGCVSGWIYKCAALWEAIEGKGLIDTIGGTLLKEAASVENAAVSRK